jgi:hypothetical protein
MAGLQGARLLNTDSKIQAKLFPMGTKTFFSHSYKYAGQVVRSPPLTNKSCGWAELDWK